MTTETNQRALSGPINNDPTRVCVVSLSETPAGFAPSQFIRQWGRLEHPSSAALVSIFEWTCDCSKTYLGWGEIFKVLFGLWGHFEKCVLRLQIALTQLLTHNNCIWLPRWTPSCCISKFDNKAVIWWSELHSNEISCTHLHVRPSWKSSNNSGWDGI